MSEILVNEARPYTETSALGDIFEWSRGRPEWLRDALRRLMVGRELTDRDIDELEAICLGSDGEASPFDRRAYRAAALGRQAGLDQGPARSCECERTGERAGSDVRRERPDNRLWRQRIGKIGLCARSQERVSLPGRQDVNFAGCERCR